MKQIKKDNSIKNTYLKMSSTHTIVVLFYYFQSHLYMQAIWANSSNHKRFYINAQGVQFYGRSPALYIEPHLSIDRITSPNPNVIRPTQQRQLVYIVYVHKSIAHAASSVKKDTHVVMPIYWACIDHELWIYHERERESDLGALSTTSHMKMGKWSLKKDLW